MALPVTGGEHDPAILESWPIRMCVMEIRLQLWNEATVLTK